MVLSGVSFIFLGLLFLNSMQSQNYKISNLVIKTLSNSEKKISYSFSLDQNLVDISYNMFLSNKYDIYSGILSLNRGPEPDVSKAYAYPNPCNIKDGCNAIIFTKLSLNCEIKIFDISGKETVTIYKNSNSDNYGWNLKDKNSINVPSGLYLYYIKDPTGTVKKGKIILIR